jgi:hypothetical protein
MALENTSAMSEFFWLQTPANPRAFSGTITQHNWTDLLAIAESGAIPDDNVQIAWGAGTARPSDVIWISPRHLVVSERFRETFARFSGWSSYPVELLGKQRELIDGYTGLAIPGKSGRIVPDRSRLEQHDFEWWFVGQYFDTSTWDGSDFFYPKFGIGPIITERARQQLLSAKISNVRTYRLPEVRYEKSMIDRMFEVKIGPFAPDDDNSTEPTL